MGGAAIVVDLPVAAVDLRKRGAGVVAQEDQDIARGGAIAFEVDHQVAVRFTRREHEGVVAGAARQPVVAATPNR